MKLVPGKMNLWKAAFVVIVTSISLVICVSIMVGTKSLVVGLLAVLAIGITSFLALWSLFGSLRGNQGKDEFNEMNLRLKEMVELTPGLSGQSEGSMKPVGKKSD